MQTLKQAAIKIQKVVRGWLYRKSQTRPPRCSEIRMRNILPKRKPPIYRKKPRQKLTSSIDKRIILIQKHIRGFIQRKKYKELYIEKMLKEQEDDYRLRIMEIEKELYKEETPKTNVSPSPPKRQKSNSLYLELPLPLSQKRNPSNPKPRSQILFEYDYYILAAIEIQRVFRGHSTRKKFGNFKKLRKNILKLQRTYRQWKLNKEGQLSLAGNLIKKQCSILSTSFTSYQHLKSLILTQDRQGSYTKVIQSCEDRLLQAGIKSSETVNDLLKQRIKELEREKCEQESFYKEMLQNTTAKYKAAIKEYLKGMKGLKFSMDLMQKSSFEQVSKIVNKLASVSRDMEGESFYETSTFLPEVSFTDKSSIGFL